MVCCGGHWLARAPLIRSPSSFCALSPHTHHHYTHTRSNENVYGRMNLLTVSGVVRLAPLAAPLAPPPPALVEEYDDEEGEEEGMGEFEGW